MQPGTRIRQYVLIEKIGQGGQAAVWSAEDEQLRRTVAIKTVNVTTQVQPGAESASSPASTPTSLEEQIRRFRAEAQIIADLEHPFILPIYDYGQHGDWLYIVMRYMAGGTLKKLTQGGNLTLGEVIKLSEPLADALDLSHQRNIVHRDIKSVNILLDSQHRPYLADFGLSVTVGDQGATSGSGTLAYMAPEQLSSNGFDHRSDLYSFGILVYEMFTGTVPSVGGQYWNLTQLMRAADLPPHEAINDDVMLVLRRATALDPDDRYASAMEMVQDLKDIWQPVTFGGAMLGMDGDLSGADALLLPITDPAMQAALEANALLQGALTKWADGAGRFRLYEEDFQYVDSFYGEADAVGVTLDEASRRLMLRGALEHGYRVEKWWMRLEEAAERRAVLLQTLNSELPAARLRAIEKLTRVVDSNPPAIPIRVATIIAHDPDPDVRVAGIRLLEGRATAATDWRQFAYGEDIDKTLATLAAKDAEARVSEAAARAIGRLRSTTATTQLAAAAIPVASTADAALAAADRALQALIDIRDEAPALPSSVDSSLRRRAFVALTLRQLLNRSYVARFVSATVGFGLAWAFLTLAATVEQFGAEATSTATILLSGVGNALIGGLFWGAVMAFPTTASIEIPLRLRAWTQAGRIALGVVAGALLYVLAFFLLRLLYYFFPDPPAWAQMVGLCAVLAAGFAIPAGAIKPTWLRSAIAAAVIFAAWMLSYGYQFETEGNVLLVYLTYGQESPLSLIFAASLGVLAYLPEWLAQVRLLFRRRGR
jgi:hypothetical protein